MDYLVSPTRQKYIVKYKRIKVFTSIIYSAFIHRIDSTIIEKQRNINIQKIAMDTVALNVAYVNVNINELYC